MRADAAAAEGPAALPGEAVRSPPPLHGPAFRCRGVPSGLLHKHELKAVDEGPDEVLGALLLATGV